MVMGTVVSLAGPKRLTKFDLIGNAEKRMIKVGNADYFFSTMDAL
jgi:hypothetical protein